MRRGLLLPGAERAVGTLVRWFVSGVLLAGLAACHPPPPPPAPVVLTPPPLVIEPPKRPEPVTAGWSFSVTQTACVARAVNREVSFTFSVASDGKLEFMLWGPALRSRVARAGARGRLLFRGRTGSWVWPARASAQHSLAGALPANKTAENDVLIALEGGMLRTELAHALIPALRIPAANVAGREWFGCVQAKIDRSNGSVAQN